MASADRPSRKTKNPMVFFRVSPAEYEAMLRASELAGATSLSSFVRSAVLFWVETHSSSKRHPEDEILSLRAKFTDFEAEFRQFMRNRLKDDSAGGRTT